MAFLLLEDRELLGPPRKPTPRSSQHLIRGTFHAPTSLWPLSRSHRPLGLETPPLGAHLANGGLLSPPLRDGGLRGLWLREPYLPRLATVLGQVLCRPCLLGLLCLGLISHALLLLIPLTVHGPLLAVLQNWGPRALNEAELLQ